MKLLVALLATLAALAPPAAAAGPPVIVGMGEQKASVFTDGRFASLGLRHARLVVPWDVMSGSRTHLNAWLRGARSAGVEPLIAFKHSRNPRRTDYLPTVREYRRAIKRFRARYPQVRVLSPWNEANHHTQPTAANPKRAAAYYGVVRRACRGCKIVAADVLDIPNMRSWLAAFRRAAPGRPRLWGLHNYADANRFRSLRASGTAEMLRAVRGEIWLTETGGLVRFAPRFRYDLRRAARATERVFDLTALSPRITRAYLYQWQADPGRPAWDSGVIDARGRARPTLRVLRRLLRPTPRGAVASRG